MVPDTWNNLHFVLLVIQQLSQLYVVVRRVGGGGGGYPLNWLYAYELPSMKGTTFGSN